MAKHWTAQETELAESLVDRRASDEECMAAVGRNFNACYCRVVSRKGSIRHPRVQPPPNVPSDVLHDARRRLTAPRTLTAWLCGDPAPGQSALERRA